MTVPLRLKLHPVEQVTQLCIGDVHASLRLRLGSSGKKPDHWFKFDGRLSLNPYKKAAKAMLPYLDMQAEEWWNRLQERMKPVAPVYKNGHGM